MNTLNMSYRRLKYSRLNREDITCLNLHKNKFSENDIQKLFIAIKDNPKITTLNLSLNKLGKPTIFIEFIHSLSHLSNITTLNISKNLFRNAHLPYLKKLMGQLFSLNLNANYLNDDGLATLLNYLNGKTKLDTLKIKDNNISDNGAKLLITHLKNNRYLTRVDIINNNISHKYIKEIENLIEANQALADFFEAIADNNTAWFKNLLKFTDPDERDYEGDSALAGAIRYGHKEIIQLLLEDQCSLININATNETALELAKRVNAAPEIIQLISTTIYQKYLAAAHTGDIATLRTMLYAGTNVYIRYERSHLTALHLAVTANHPTIIQQLSQYHDLFLMRDKNGHTALQLAETSSPNSPLVVLLKKIMHDALITEITKGNIPTINALIANGVNPNDYNTSNNLVPLIHALSTKNLAVLNALVTNGTDLFIRDKDDNELWDLAEKLADKEILDWLKDKIYQELLKYIKNHSLDNLSDYLNFKIGKIFLSERGNDLLNHAINNNRRDIADFIDKRLHANDKYVQAQFFNIEYLGKSTHKTVPISVEKIHNNLKSTIQCTLQNIKSSKEAKTLNLVAAELSFIITDRTHIRKGAHGRRLVTVPVNPPKDFLHVENFYSLKNVDGVPKSLALLNDVLKTSPTSAHNQINKYYSSNEFHRRFHHSERALYAYLIQKDSLDNIVKILTEIIDVPAKIYALGLHFHSTNSPCDYCADSMPYQYSPQNEFIKKLIQTLENHGYSVLTKSKTIASFVTISYDTVAENSKYLTSGTICNTISASVNINHNHKAQRVIVLQKDNRSSSPTQTHGMFTNFGENKRAKIQTHTQNTYTSDDPREEPSPLLRKDHRL